MARDFSKPFYRTAAWQTARGIALRRDLFTCQMCGARAEEVHHIHEMTPTNMDDDNVTLDTENLISLCRDCHFKVHKQARSLRTTESNKLRKKPDTLTGYEFDEQGNVVPVTKEVYIIYGAPCSGKTSYVRDYKSVDDLVVDLDKIGEALSLTQEYDRPSAILDASIKVRDFLYQMIVDRKVLSSSIWVIAGLPDKQQRESLKQRLNATLIHISTTREECLRRAMRDEKRVDKALQRKVIDKYFNRYQP